MLSPPSLMGALIFSRVDDRKRTPACALWGKGRKAGCAQHRWIGEKEGRKHRRWEREREDKVEQERFEDTEKPWSIPDTAWKRLPCPHSQAEASMGVIIYLNTQGQGDP